MTPAAIAAIALSLVPRPADPAEAEAAYRPRLLIIGGALEEGARAVPWWFGRRAMVAAALAIWEGESRFALDIHEGRRRGDGGRANCMGGIHPGKLASDWAELGGAGEEPSFRCARATMRNLRSKAWECLAPGMIAPGAPELASMAIVFEGYARGHCGDPGPESRRRAEMFGKILRRLE